MPNSFRDHLAHFETALAARPLSYDTLIEIIRGLKVPADVDAADLTRYFDCCYRILDFEKKGFGARLRAEAGGRGAGHLEACAREMIEHVLFDRVGSNRAWVEGRVAWFQEQGREVPEAYVNHELPPALGIPWDETTARARVRPLLMHLETQLTDAPTAHFRLCWSVMRDGYPIFRKIFSEWMRELDSKGLGQPGTVAAFTKANELLRKAEDSAVISWAVCEREIVPLLDDPHPMIVAGAARYLGALYEGGSFQSTPEAPDMNAVLDRLSRLSRYRAIACGAFICGFDADFAGLSALSSNSRLGESGFSVDEWIVKIVAGDDDEPYLPNAQALWFYIHEHYYADPAMVTHFIDLDRTWLALMCATEAPEKVSGMKPVLERLAAVSDRVIADAAKAHLEAHYR